VVAVFQGEGVNNRGVRLVSATQGDEMVVRYYNKYFTTGYGEVVYTSKEQWDKSWEGELKPAPVAGKSGVPATAYGIFVFPRISKPLVIEENVQITKGEPPVWKARARTKDGLLVPVENVANKASRAAETDVRP